MPRWELGNREIGKLGLGVLVVLVLAVAVQAQGTGVLHGQVLNGTADGPAVGAGIPVTLYVFRGDTEVDVLETTTDADGSFRFEGLDTNPELEYRPEILYSDVIYRNAEPFRFDDTMMSPIAVVTVYETTDDDSAVQLDSVHLIAESFGDVLRISEIHLFGNSGDRTYVGADGTTIRIPLPQGAVGLSFGEGVPEERYIEVDDGLVDTEPLPPGSESSMVFFSYHLMSPGGTIPLERRFAYPVVNFNVLVAQPGLTLTGEQLQAMGTELFQDRQYEFYVAQNLPVDTPLAMEFVSVADTSGAEGMPELPAGGGEPAAEGAVKGNQALLRWFGFGLAGLAVIGLVVYVVTIGRPVSATASGPGLPSRPEARRLLADLADLDEAFEAGNLDEAAYERQRAAKYEALKTL